MKKLNFGCGKDYKDGFVNVDRSRQVKVDFYLDLDIFPYPFKSNTFEYVRCWAVLAHLHNPDKALEEIHRICKKGAIIKILVPYYKADISACDITMHSRFSETSFNNFLEDHPFGFETNCRFRILQLKKIPSGGKLRFLPFKKLLDKFLWNIYEMIYVKLQVIK